jgi:hypothetical protein
LKWDIDGAEFQSGNPVAVKNHLDFCLMVISLTLDFFTMDRIYESDNYSGRLIHV